MMRSSGVLRSSLALLLLACGVGAAHDDMRPPESGASAAPVVVTDSAHAAALALETVRGDATLPRDGPPDERLIAVARADSAGFLVLVTPACEPPPHAPAPGALAHGKRVSGYGCGGGDVTVRVPRAGPGVIVSRGE